MNLTVFKQKGVGAKKGYELLKKKSDALKARFRALLKEIKNVCSFLLFSIFLCFVEWFRFLLLLNQNPFNVV